MDYTKNPEYYKEESERSPFPPKRSVKIDERSIETQVKRNKSPFIKTHEAALMPF